MKTPFSSEPIPPPESRRLMTNARLDTLIRELSGEVEGQLGYWRFLIEKRDLLVIADEHHNRMRIVTPIIEQEKLDKHDMKLSTPIVGKILIKAPFASWVLKVLYPIAPFAYQPLALFFPFIYHIKD